MSSDSPFVVCGDRQLAELIDAAMRRIVLVAPAVNAVVADAVTRAWGRLASEAVRSNLMVADEQHRPMDKYLPGDFLHVVKPWLFDRRVGGDVSYQQVVEYEQYLVCALCGRTCAGTCQR